MLRYSLVAGGLGIGWFVVLLIPRLTREWLLADIGRNLVCMVAASILVAVACRGLIMSASTFQAQLVRAAAIPYLGCLVFLSLWAAQLWARTVLGHGLANLHDTLSLYLMGLAAVTMSLFVVIPYGLLCQYVMKSVSPSRSE